MKICDEKLCSGCGLCREVCPRSAITMVEDSEGFLRPVADSEKCNGCGVCVKKCPVNLKDPKGPTSAFAAYAKDADVRARSSSGGVFACLAESVIEKGGSVFGAGFGKDLKVVHKMASDKESLAELMGSKYVQSDVTDVYGDLSDAVKSGRPVLFSGSPCQCAAVRNLFFSADNLWICDFICHGVPTPKIWDKLIREEHPLAEYASFRDKKRGWEEFSLKIEENGKVYNESRYKDPYLRLFLRNVTLRPSCHSCSWKADGFASDITLADFWGVSKCLPHMNDDKGVSLVLVRSEKGRELFDSVADKLYVEESNIEDAVRSNGMYASSTPRPNDRDEFFAMLSRGAAFKEIAARFAPPMKAAGIAKMRLRTKIKKMIGTVYRIKAKKK